MEVHYNIIAVTNLDYNRENALIVLQRGKDLGFVYYRGHEEALIGIDEAADQLLKEAGPLDDSGFLSTKIDDTFVFMYFESEKTRLSVVFFPNGNDWIKQDWYANRPEIDLGRYMCTLINLCDPFDIIELRVKEYE